MQKDIMNITEIVDWALAQEDPSKDWHTIVEKLHEISDMELTTLTVEALQAYPGNPVSLVDGPNTSFRSGIALLLTRVIHDIVKTRRSRLKHSMTPLARVMRRPLGMPGVGGSISDREIRDAVSFPDDGHGDSRIMPRSSEITPENPGSR